MVYFVLVLLTLLSCVLFEFSGMAETLKSLVGSYKRQFQLMGDSSLEDDERIEEIAKLLSGEQVTSAALTNARELLKI